MNLGNLGITSCFCILSYMPLESYAQCFFYKAYRYANNAEVDYCRSLLFINNGDLIACGSTVVSPGNAAVFIIKLNQCGDTIWQKVIDNSPVGGEDGNTILQITDSILCIVGSHHDSTQGTGEGHVYWIDANGDSLSEKIVNAGYNERLIDAIYENKLIAIAGYYNVDTPNAKVYLLKTNSVGDILWQYDYGADTIYHYLTNLDKTLDGGYILSGRTDRSSNDTSYRNLYLIKTDSIGNFMWEKIYDIPLPQTVGYGIATQDSGYILVANHGNTVTDEYYGYVIKTDAFGNIEWDSLYGNPIVPKGFSIVKQLADGNYIVGGYDAVIPGGMFVSGPHLYLAKMNQVGDMLWERTYSYFGGTTHNYIEDMVFTDDGDIVATGYIIPFGMPNNNSNDAFILKTDSCGYLESNSINASFSMSLDTLNRTIYCSNQSTDYCTASWYFGDGDSLYQKNATHTYSSPGTYTITLIVRAGNSLDTLQQQVNIPDSCGYVSSPDINAAFTYSIDTFTVSFMNLSEDHCTSQWYFGDGSSSSLLHPAHTYADTGKYIVTLLVKAGISESILLRQIHITTPVGMSNVQSILNEILLYPNPAYETINILSLHTNYSIGNISITDISGKEILNTTQTEISVSQLANGLYFVRVELTNGQSAVRKVIVQ